MKIENTIPPSTAQSYSLKDTIKEKDVSFIENIKSNDDTKKTLTQEDLTFQKINGMTIGEIESFYANKRESALLNTLKLSTLFSSNLSMNEAMFNSVLSQGNLEDSQAFLYNMAFNRNSYLNSSQNYGSMIRKSIINQLDGDVKIQQIELEKEFQYTMLQFDISQHMSDMMDFSKNERDKNKSNSDLSFMYSNMYLQYQGLFDEYNSIENSNTSLLSAQLANSRINFLNF